VTRESERIAAYRSAVVALLCPAAHDLGRIERDRLPAFDGDAVADLDTQRPDRLTPAALGAWATANGVTLAGAAPWALALGVPDDNAGLRETHARESELANLRSFTDANAALAEARFVVETRIAPWLPLTATRRALVHLRAGANAAVTAGVVAALTARATTFRGTIASATIAAAVPDARAVAADLARDAADFRAEALLTKLVHAAIVRHAVPDLAPLFDDAATASVASDAVARLELDRALVAFAHGWASDAALAPWITYRGVRIDDLALRLLLRRHGHPAYEAE
jgi:hypothetical protein